MENSQKNNSRRLKGIILTALAGMAGKIATAASIVISIPLTLNYLGEARFGLWMTISSVLTFLSLADLGVGNGLVSALSECDGKSDYKKARSLVNSGFWVLVGASIVLCVISFALFISLPWTLIYNVSHETARNEAAPATLALMVVAALNLPTSVAAKVQTAYQQGFKTATWTTLGTVISIVAVFAAVKCDYGIVGLVISSSLGNTVAGLGNFYQVFWHQRPELRPSHKPFLTNLSESKYLTTSGLIFFSLQILAILGNASDQFIIAHFEGVSPVAAFTIIQRLFLVTQITQYFVAPLWPAFGEALARGDSDWAEKTLKKSIKVSFTVSLAVALPISLWAGEIIHFWTKGGVAPQQELLTPFVLWTILAGYGGIMSSFLNHGNLLRKQMWIYVSASLIALLLKLVLVPKFGAPGAIWATNLAYGIFYCAPAYILAIKHLHVIKATTK